MKLYFTTTPEQERRSFIMNEITKTLGRIFGNIISKEEGKNMLHVLYRQFGLTEQETINVLSSL